MKRPAPIQSVVKWSFEMRLGLSNCVLGQTRSHGPLLRGGRKSTHNRISHRARAVTKKNVEKNVTARVELFFCLLNLIYCFRSSRCCRRRR